MSARDELTAMFAPFLSGTVLEEAVGEAYALVLNEAADKVAALIEDGEHDPDCLVDELCRMAASTPPVPDNATDEGEFAVRWPDGELTPVSDREHGLRAIESAGRAEPGAVLMQRSCTPWTEVTS